MNRTSDSQLKTLSHTPGVAEQLLADFQEVFAERKTSRISTADLIGAICADVEKPWASYSNGNPITYKQLKNILKVYGISSKNLRMGSEVKKGYTLEQFKESFPEQFASHSPDACRYTLQAIPALDLSRYTLQAAAALELSRYMWKPARELDCSLCVDENHPVDLPAATGTPTPPFNGEKADENDPPAVVGTVWKQFHKQGTLEARRESLGIMMDAILRQAINDIDAGKIWNITPEGRRIEDDIDRTYGEVLAGSKTIEEFNALCLCWKSAGTQGTED